MTAMSRIARVLVALAGLASAAAGWAQAQPAAVASPPARSEPQVERRVVEDDGVRIEQVNYRGQVQSVVVQSKVGSVRPYEIVLGRHGRDPSLYPGAIGQSRWSVVRF